jgi:hypothetical protein
MLSTALEFQAAPTHAWTLQQASTLKLPGQSHTALQRAVSFVAPHSLSS